MPALPGLPPIHIAAMQIKGSTYAVWASKHIPKPKHKAAQAGVSKKRRLAESEPTASTPAVTSAATASGAPVDDGSHHVRAGVMSQESLESWRQGHKRPTKDVGEKFALEFVRAGLGNALSGSAIGSPEWEDSISVCNPYFVEYLPSPGQVL